MESKKAEDIKNLLLKIVLPLAFPVAGSFISDLMTKRANRHSYVDVSGTSSVQYDPSGSGSTCEEDQEQEMESTRRASTRNLAQSGNAACSAAADRFLISEFSRQASNVGELVEASAASENAAEVAVNSGQDGGDLAATAADEIATLKRLVSGLEERACSIESEFHDYCDAKEQESAYQKMQIMCLGMKLDLLESQNQRLEAAAAEVRASAAGEVAAMRGKLERLQSRLKKVTRRRKRDLDAVGERILALDAEQAQMTRRCDGFEQYAEEMKRLTLQLQEQKEANSENVEVAVERSLQKLSSGRDLVDGLEALRDRWAADMEEMIYLGWITAWLQHDLLLRDELGTVVVGDDDDDSSGGDDPPEQEQETEKRKKGDTVVAEVAPSTAVRLCKAASSSASSSSASLSGPPRRSVDGEPSCLGFPAADGGAGRAGWAGIARPRLLRKLRGWAGGNGKGKGKRPRRIVGPCCPK